MTMYDRASRALSHVKSVFFRLIISYILLVSAVAITISVVALVYFQSRYNQELESFHELYLATIGKELENQVVDTSKRIYFEISNLLSQSNGDLLSPEDTSNQQPAKLYLSYQMLNALVAQHYEKIEAIHLYYVRQNVQISSTGVGLTNSDRWSGDGQRGLAEMKAAKQAQRWSVFDRPEYFGVPAVTLFRSDRCYPILSSPGDCSVVISLDFRSSYIKDIIKRLQPEDGGITLLVSPDFLVKFDDPDESDARLRLEAGLSQALPAGVTPGIRQSIVKVDGSSLLSLGPIADTGWYLANLVSHRQLYQRGEGIRLVLALICLAAIIAGIVLASFLSSSIYNPLQRLVDKLRSLVGIPDDEARLGHDEYRLMDTALDGISTRMGELQATIEANRPAIKNELLARILAAGLEDRDSLREGLVLLGLPPLPDQIAVAAVMAWQPQTDLFQSGALGPIQKYRIIEQLELDFPGFLLAGTLPGGGIGLVAGLCEGEFPVQELSSRLAVIREQSGLHLTLSIGGVVAPPLTPAAVLSIALKRASYHFLFPEEVLFAEQPELLVRKGQSALPGTEFLESLHTALAGLDLKQFRARLDHYRQAARSGTCSPESCREDLESVNLVVAEYARSRQGNSSLERHLRDLLAEADNLDVYLDELTSVASDLCAGTDHPQRQRNAVLVDRIQAHVRANLANDLSLDRVGHAVAVSPGYMCKIFKEETGQNFVSYVTEVRLEAAARRLCESRDPIQEIGMQVGFHTPAYFIRLFKNRFGHTPLEYRRNHPGA